MTAPVLSDAYQIKKLIREAEAISDEAMIACSKLKQAMIMARQNPEIPVHAGQKAIVRLSQAEDQAMRMSSSLLRVHHELSKVAREFAGADGDIPTEIPAASLQTVAALAVEDVS